MIAASIARDLGYYEILGFLNDVVSVGSQIGRYATIPVIGKTNDLPQYLSDEDVVVFIAYVGMQKEKEVFERIEKLNIPNNRFATLIHPTAILPKRFCSVGRGVLMAPLSQISPDVSLADNCILLPNSFVGHDSSLSRFAHVATNGVIGANVKVGKAVHVGSNATIREKVIIGDFSLVGSGAVVLEDVPKNSIVVGNPARVLRRKE
jgi:acetyltransferase EpsM